MKVLDKRVESRIPFDWLNLEDMASSSCFRVEIYLPDGVNPNEHLKAMFYQLFTNFKYDLVVANGRWGDFCLDIWNPETDEYDYALDDKEAETRSYLEMLLQSNIEFDYEGLCVCKDWDSFLDAVIPCVTNHLAPFSPMLYNVDEQFVFYFHHTGSIGLLYRNQTKTIDDICACAKLNGYSIEI